MHRTSGQTTEQCSWACPRRDIATTDRAFSSAAALFCAARAYAGDDADEMTGWLGIEVPETRLPSVARRCVADGGWVTLHAPEGRSWACVRFPNFRFRPSHADALHFDLWSGGVNLVRDAGSFGYAATEPWQSYFPGTSAHSTVEFDGRDQMPRIGSFLFGSWTAALDGRRRPGATAIVRSGLAAIAMRADVVIAVPCGRMMESGLSSMRLTERRSVRLPAGVWPMATTRSGTDSCAGSRIEIAIEGTHEVTPTLAEGYDSRFYRERTSLPVSRGRSWPRSHDHDNDDSSHRSKRPDACSLLPSALLNSPGGDRDTFV